MHAKPSWQRAQTLGCRTSGSDEGRPGVGRLAGYDAVRIVLGLVVVTAEKRGRDSFIDERNKTPDPFSFLGQLTHLGEF
jgi:hypothetical protein